MNRQRYEARPLVRRDSEGHQRTAPDWESLTERLIREAQQAGQFDGLPNHGRPLPPDDATFAGDMAAANNLLRSAGTAPPWIEADREVRAHRARIERLLVQAHRSAPHAAARLSRQLDAIADAHDDAARRLEPLAPTLRQHRRPIDRAELRARLLSALSDTPDAT